MKRGEISIRLASCAAGAALLFSGLVAGSAPARAFDDKPSTFDPLLNVIGLGKDNEEKPQIDYRERPKLVVPKGADLPPPQTSAGQRAANWPQDPDIVRRRQAAAAERAPRAININKNPVLTNDEIQQGRSNAPATAQELCDVRNAGVPDCGALTPADKLKQVFSLGSNANTDTLKPGVEPPREYLTEPPAGYRTGVSAVKDTARAPNRSYESPSAGDYARGVDPNKTAGE